jgi:phage portal protein BeeE
MGWWDRWVWSRVANREALTLEQFLASEATPTAAGVPVTTDHALRRSAVWACVRLLADAVSTLPLTCTAVATATQCLSCRRCCATRPPA